MKRYILVAVITAFAAAQGQDCKWGPQVVNDIPKQTDAKVIAPNTDECTIAPNATISKFKATVTNPNKD